MRVHAGPSRFRPGGRAGAAGNIFQLIVTASARDLCVALLRVAAAPP